VAHRRMPEDEKVSTDELQEKIAEFDDYVQSTDIAAMQSKIRLLSNSPWSLTVSFRTLNSTSDPGTSDYH